MTILLGITGGLIGLWAANQLDASGWLLTLLLQIVAAALLVSVFAALARPRRKRQ